ncbi:hypothetical protein Tco_0833762, partial [Tanacetum coccineum]
KKSTEKSTGQSQSQHRHGQVKRKVKEEKNTTPGTEIAIQEKNTTPEVELKELPPHLEYAFLEGDDKLPVIIAKDLKDKEKAALLKVLKSHKRAIAWKLSDIQGINPEFCTHKILMEEDYKPAVQHQRRVNPKIHDVIKNEVEKLLDAGLIYPISDTMACLWDLRTLIRSAFSPKLNSLAMMTVQHQRRVNPKIHDVIKKEVEKLLEAGLIYPISDSPWVSPIHCVPKKGGMTVVVNEENELIPTRLVTGWRVCIDYRKLNEATRKDHGTDNQEKDERQSQQSRKVNQVKKSTEKSTGQSPS